MDEPKSNQSNWGVCRKKIGHMRVCDIHRNFIASHIWRNTYTETYNHKNEEKPEKRHEGSIYIYLLCPYVYIVKGKHYIVLYCLQFMIVYGFEWIHIDMRRYMPTKHLTQKHVLKGTSAHSDWVPDALQCAIVHPNVYSSLVQCSVQFILLHVCLHKIYSIFLYPEDTPRGQKIFQLNHVPLIFRKLAPMEEKLLGIIENIWSFI